MKITQITDLHIGFENQNTFGVDVRHNFLMILGEIKINEPDIIILTGDLCFDYGDASIYAWIKERMDKLQIPYAVIPGNHDNQELLRDAFEINYTQDEIEIYFAKKIGKKTALFLDSSQASMSDAQLKWLKRQLKQLKEEVLIFTHYPPLPLNTPFMDKKHGFKKSDELLKIFDEFNYQIYLFCGHYHTEKSLHRKNLHVFLCPSLVCQIDQNNIEFEVDHYDIGFRDISLKKESLITNVRYLKGKSLATEKE